MDHQDKNGGPNHLREWREKRGLSQAELAALVDTAPNMIQYLETGERALTARWLRKLAGALNISIAQILDEPPGDGLAPVPYEVREVWGRIVAQSRGKALRALELFADDEASSN